MILGSGPSPFPPLRFFFPEPLPPEPLPPEPLALEPFPPPILAFRGGVVCICREAGVEKKGDEHAATAVAATVRLEDGPWKRLERGVVDGSLVKRPRKVGVNIVLKPAYQVSL